MARKIVVFTSSRAEYGLLRRVITRIQECNNLELKLLASGTHLVSRHGRTIKEIQMDGITEIECVDINVKDDSAMGILNSMGKAMEKYGHYLYNLSPDILLLLGDRYETFCCAAAAQVCKVPVAHIHGGERTEGLVDEAFRHSITKMSHLHFPCCNEYKQRIVQMGEDPETVHNVGSLGVENIRNMDLLSLNKLEALLGFKLDRPFFLITFHPVTLEKISPGEQFSELLAALDDYPDFKFIFTGANADTNGAIINKMINEYVRRHPDKCFARASLGSLRYLSAMNLCKIVIGNSSSGILEAPALNVPTINIGERQRGRIKARSIIDCEPRKGAIVKSVDKILSREFQFSMENIEIPHEKEGTSGKIVQILKTIELDHILKKKFFDI